MSDGKDASADVSLQNFEHLDAVSDITAHIHALEMFDAQAEIRELKALAVERAGVRPGRSVLDVGCGFGRETLRPARLVGHGGEVSGIDGSAGFIAQARRRAKAGGFRITFDEGDAERLRSPIPASAVPTRQQRAPQPPEGRARPPVDRAAPSAWHRGSQFRRGGFQTRVMSRSDAGAGCGIAKRLRAAVAGQGPLSWLR